MQQNRRRDLPGWMQWLDVKVLAAAVGVALVLFCCSGSLLWLTRPDAGQVARVTAVLNVIPAGLSTPTVNLGTAQVTPAEQTPPAAGELGVGAYVQINGTGGTGLRLRDQPGLNGKVLLVGGEAEVFYVEQGPQQVDGYTWWYLVASFDNTRRGWAVADYLKTVAKP